MLVEHTPKRRAKPSIAILGSRLIAELLSRVMHKPWPRIVTNGAVGFLHIAQLRQLATYVTKFELDQLFLSS